MDEEQIEEITRVIYENVAHLDLILRRNLWNDPFHKQRVETMFPNATFEVPENFDPPPPNIDFTTVYEGDRQEYLKEILKEYAGFIGIHVKFDNDPDYLPEPEPPNLPRKRKTKKKTEKPSSEPGTKTTLDRSSTIELVPFHDIIQNSHICIHSDKANAKIVNLDKIQNQRAYLGYSNDSDKFTLFQDIIDQESGLRNSPWKTSSWIEVEIVIQFDGSSLPETTRIPIQSAKQFKTSGVEIFWKIDSDGLLLLEYYVDTTKIPNNFAGATDLFPKHAQNQIAPIINKLIKESFNNVNLSFWKDYDNHEKMTNSLENFQQFFDALETWNKSWKVTDNFELREDLLKCKLMEYQKITVKWMIEKELQPRKTTFFDLFEHIEFRPNPKSTDLKPMFYYPAFGFFTKTNEFDHEFNARGGILADEMGLGKTIEMLALIMSNAKGREVNLLTGDDVEKKSDDKPTPVHQRKIISEEDLTRNRFNWEEYHSAKKVDKTNGPATVYTVTEENLRGGKNKPETSKDDKTLYKKCEKCQELCVIAKCGWKEEFGCEFWCPQCMATKEPLDVKTTLIVLPESLVLQWFDEISRHCSENLKVMFYFGLNKNGYVHPCDIANYDVVLTTYDTLRSELDFANFKNTASTRLRNGQRSNHKFSPTSITHVHWWRIVADESQLVEGAARKAPQMCSLIQSHFRWCLTGTPMVRSVLDLYGLFRFINFWPFNVETFWREQVVMEYQKMPSKFLGTCWLLRLAGQVIRRNSKKMVEHEICLPELIEIEKRVVFSTIEERQYNEEKENVKGIVEAAIGNTPDDVMLSTMSSRVQKEKILWALGKLRETLISCGEHVNFHKQKNMFEQVVFGPENVMLRLIRSKKTQIEEYLREAISLLFAEAGIFWMQGKYMEAALKYEQSVDLMAFIDEVNKHFQQVMKIEIDDIENDTSDEELNDVEEDEEKEHANRKVRNEVKIGRFVRKKRVMKKLKDLKTCRKKREYIPKNSDGCSSGSSSDDEDEEEKEVEDVEKAEGNEQNNEEGDEMPRRKVRKLENGEQGSSINSAIAENDDDDREKLIAKRKAERAHHIMERKAMRLLSIDCTMISHFYLNMRELHKVPEVTGKMEEIFEKMGGMDAILKDYHSVLLRYAKTEHAGLLVAKKEYERWVEEWALNKNEHIGLMRSLQRTSTLYQKQEKEDPELSQYSLTDKILASTKSEPILTEMSVWPVFSDIREHLADGQDVVVLPAGKKNKEVRLIPHNIEKCMGVCNGKSIKDISEDYAKCTNSELLYRMERYIGYLEFLRNTLFVEYSKLLDFFTTMPFDKLVELQESIEENGESRDSHKSIIYCKHRMIKDEHVKLTADFMKKHGRKNCLLCSVRYRILFLRFEMGMSSFHGIPKSGPNPLVAFYTLVCGFERRSNTSIGLSQQMNDFRAYMDRFRRTVQTIDSSLVIVQEYCNRIQEMTSSKFRTGIEEMRLKARGSENKTDEEVGNQYLNAYGKEAVHKEERARGACQELRYLSFLYDKERGGITDSDENICLICGLNMESLAVYPCGHRICEDCYRQFRNRKEPDGRKNNQVECVTCRGKYNARLIMVARASSNRNTEFNVIPGVTLAVKLETSIQLMRDIIAENSQNKIILFTTLEIGTHIWRFLTRVLQKAKMPFIEISRSEYGKRVFTFEFSDECKILLCSLSMCANGLNLTQANHIIFLDPTHLSSVVAQAIGRISRYGQSSKMKVYHMIVESSIDEELRRIATAEGTEPGLLQQKERTWTVGEIRQIFGISQ